MTGMLLTSSYLSANLFAASLPDRSYPSASSVVGGSAVTFIVKLLCQYPSFSRLSDVVLFLQLFLVANSVYRRNLAFVCGR